MDLATISYIANSNLKIWIQLSISSFYTVISAVGNDLTESASWILHAMFNIVFIWPLNKFTLDSLRKNLFHNRDNKLINDRASKQRLKGIFGCDFEYGINDNEKLILFIRKQIDLIKKKLLLYVSYISYWRKVYCHFRINEYRCSDYFADCTHIFTSHL